MVDRCCTLCSHNPYIGAAPGLYERICFRLMFLSRWRFGRAIMRLLLRYIAKDGPPGCQKNSRIFCYDVHGSEGCRRSLATARPEFLACKACGAFAPKHEVAGDG